MAYSERAAPRPIVWDEMEDRRVGGERRLQERRPLERGLDRNRRDRSPQGVSRQRRTAEVPPEDRPEVGSIVTATITGIKGSLGLFIEVPAGRRKISGLVHLSEARRLTFCLRLYVSSTACATGRGSPGAGQARLLLMYSCSVQLQVYRLTTASCTFWAACFV